MILADKGILAWNTEDKIRHDFVTCEKTNKMFRREKNECTDNGKNMKE